MKNLKEDNIQKSLWHIKRHCENIEKNTDDSKRKIELLHLKESIEILKRVLNDEKPYPILDREEVFWNMYPDNYLGIILFNCRNYIGVDLLHEYFERKEGRYTKNL